MTSTRIKVFFPIEPASANGVTGEWLWMEPAGLGKYRVDNLPFELYDISYGDVVSAAEKDGALTFQSVLSRGGHSTYRVRLPEGGTHEDFLQFWPLFEAHNCSYEGASDTRRLYSIDVPNGDAVFAIYPLLEKGEKQGWFEFEEAHFCRPSDRH